MDRGDVSSYDPDEDFSVVLAGQAERVLPATPVVRPTPGVPDAPAAPAVPAAPSAPAPFDVQAAFASVNAAIAGLVKKNEELMMGECLKV